MIVDSSYSEYQNRKLPFLTNNSNDNENEYTNDCYLCVKEFNAINDSQIDIKENDIVSLNSFSGVYISGKNLNTKTEGLYPIYYIESLNGNPIFFRCKKEMEFAKVNDEIFLIYDSPSSQIYPGYNITKGEQGSFMKNNLEPIIMDDETRNKYEALYDDNNSYPQSRSMSHSTTNSNINYYNKNFSNNINNSTNSSYENYGHSENDGNNGNNKINENNGNNGNNKINENNGNNGNNKINEINNGNSSNMYILRESLEEEKINKENKQLNVGLVIEYLLNYYQSIDDPLDLRKNRDRMRELNENLKEINGEDIRVEDKKGKMKMMKKDEKNKIKPKEGLSDRINEILDKCEKFKDEEYRKNKWKENNERCKELVDKEKEYCNNLKIMIEKFKIPLEEAVGTINEILNSVQIHIIFQYIPDIYEFSCKLCKELGEAYEQYEEEGPIPIANVFLNNLSKWQIYIKYIESYYKAKAIFENLKGEQANHFNKFMEYCKGSLEYNYQDLKLLISLPLQRFRGYELIFKDIVNNSDPSHEENYNLLETIENFISEHHYVINRVMELEENMNKMFSISKFPNDLISLKRNYVGEWVIKEGRKEKMLYLYSDIVVFASINKRSKDKIKYEYERHIDILDYDIEITTNGIKRGIKLIKTERNGTPNHNNRSIHSQHSLISNRRSTQSTITIMFIIQPEIESNYFINKYKEQKDTFKK